MKANIQILSRISIRSQFSQKLSAVKTLYPTSTLYLVRIFSSNTQNNSNSTYFWTQSEFWKLNSNATNFLTQSVFKNHCSIDFPCIRSRCFMELVIWIACAATPTKDRNQEPKLVGPQQIGDNSGQTSGGLQTTIVSILDHLSLITTSGTIGLISLIVITGAALLCLWYLMYSSPARGTCCSSTTKAGEQERQPYPFTVTDEAIRSTTPFYLPASMTSQGQYLAPPSYRRSLGLQSPMMDPRTSGISWRSGEDYVTVPLRPNQRPRQPAGPHMPRSRRLHQPNPNRRMTTRMLTESQLNPNNQEMVSGIPSLEDPAASSSNATLDAEELSGEESNVQQPNSSRFRVPALEF